MCSKVSVQSSVRGILHSTALCCLLCLTGKIFLCGAVLFFLRAMGLVWLVNEVNSILLHIPVALTDLQNIAEQKECDAAKEVENENQTVAWEHGFVGGHFITPSSHAHL